MAKKTYKELEDAYWQSQITIDRYARDSAPSSTCSVCGRKLKAGHYICNTCVKRNQPIVTCEMFDQEVGLCVHDGRECVGDGCSIKGVVK